MNANDKFLAHYASVSEAYEGCSLVTVLDAGLNEAMYTMQELEADKATLEAEVRKTRLQIHDIEQVIEQYERMLRSAKLVDSLQDAFKEKIENG